MATVTALKKTSSGDWSGSESAIAARPPITLRYHRSNHACLLDHPSLRRRDCQP